MIYAIFSASYDTGCSRFSVTTPIADQFRVSPDQYFGVCKPWLPDSTDVEQNIRQKDCRCFHINISACLRRGGAWSLSEIFSWFVVGQSIAISGSFQAMQRSLSGA